jgi:hypothetical protein
VREKCKGLLGKTGGRERAWLFERKVKEYMRQRAQVVFLGRGK